MPHPGILYPTSLYNIDTWKSDRVARYSGSDRKDGVISPDGRRYLIKYASRHTRKNDMDTSYVNNVLSEYLSSHILTIIGYPVHDTFLATRSDQLVVACENFIPDNKELIEFGHYMRKQYDSVEIGRVPKYSQIKQILSTDPDLKTNPDEPPEPAPVYDNGSTLFPALSSEAMKNEVLTSAKEILRRTILFPKAAMSIQTNKISYFDMLSSNFDPAMTRAVLRMVPVIQRKMPDIFIFIDAQTFLSDTKKTFYKTILQARLNFLLKQAYENRVLLFPRQKDRQIKPV